MQESARANIRIRTLVHSDIPFADSIRELAGWNQIPADWERFLAAEPAGCFLAEWNGEPAGTATTISYGAELAWIGMVLVHPRFRRRGIGKSLLHHCIRYLQKERGIRCIKLDATPAGQLVYDGLGFQTEWSLNRYEGKPNPRANPKPVTGIRPWNDADLVKVLPLDTAAFGASRESLLGTLAKQAQAGQRCPQRAEGANNPGPHGMAGQRRDEDIAALPAGASVGSVVYESACGKVAGYGLARAGAQAVYLGPIAACSPEAGILVAEALLGRLAGESIFWDIPHANQPAIELASGYGLTVQRPLIRMYLGSNIHPGDPRLQFALAGPEVG